MVITRFDVFKNPSGAKDWPWVVVVQHDLLDRLSTRLVIPLARKSALGGAVVTRLNPVWTMERVAVVLMTQQMGAVRTEKLTQRVSSLAAHRAEILAAIDVLISGV